MPLEDQLKDNDTNMEHEEGAVGNSGDNGRSTPVMEEDQSTSISHGLDSSGEGEVFKRQRINSPKRATYNVGPNGASPRKHATFEELLAQAGIVTNMKLAHEIVVDGNFQLQQSDFPENSLEKQVKEVVHRAFWDSLRSQLAEDPPRYENAVSLLGEVKEFLFSILLPYHERLRLQIDESIDLALIQQQAEQEILDVMHYANFIIGIMGKLCAPVRDDDINLLKELTDVVELFKEILRVLELMKLDMLNFTLQSLRPHLQHQSVEYERAKFAEFLKTQQDGLELTREWLRESGDDLKSKVQQQPPTPPSAAAVAEGVSSASASPQPLPVGPAAILTHAYIQLLGWKESQLFPETMTMDKGRILEFGHQFERAVLLASVLLVTYTNVGAAISEIQGFPSKLKHHLIVLLEGVKDLQSVIPNIAEAVCSEVNKCQIERGRPELETDKLEALKAQVLAVGDKQHTLHKLLESRAESFLRMIISMPLNFDPTGKTPMGLSTVERQLVELSKQYARLLSHNRSVFGPDYSKILRELINSP